MNQVGGNLTTELKIYGEPVLTWFQALGFAAFAGIIVFFRLLDAAQGKHPPSPEFAGDFMCVAMVICCAWSVRCARHPRPVIVLNRAGITYRRWPTTRMLKWESIDDAYHHWWPYNHDVRIIPKPKGPESTFGAILRRSGLLSTHWVIHTYWLSISADDLISEIRRRVVQHEAL